MNTYNFFKKIYIIFLYCIIYFEIIIIHISAVYNSYQFRFYQMLSKLIIRFLFMIKLNEIYMKKM